MAETTGAGMFYTSARAEVFVFRQRTMTTNLTKILPKETRLAMDDSSVGFIGAGKTATVLALALCHVGYAVTAIASRTLASATSLAAQLNGCTAYPNSQDVADKCNLVFITTPDSAISTIASCLKWHRNQAVIHCSGADSTAPLVAATEQGAITGGFHPLQSFTNGAAPTTLQGITFALEAEGPLLTELKTMASALGGRWIILSAEDKALYHASAVIASNYLVTLASAAAGLWAKFGISPSQAITALLPLMKSTVANIEQVGLPYCLTGPIARGDAITVHRHLQALESLSPDLEAAYRELGKLTLPLAHVAGGLDQATIENLIKALNE